MLDRIKLRVLLYPDADALTKDESPFKTLQKHSLSTLLSLIKRCSRVANRICRFRYIPPRAFAALYSPFYTDPLGGHDPLGRRNHEENTNKKVLEF